MAEITQRPEYHFTPRKGWINDPNGLYYLDGRWHILYQYNAEDTVWGSPSIGHAVTSDFVCYDEADEALIPHEDYEIDSRGGCFSGSVISKDDELCFIYTGSVFKEEKLKQTQNLAFSEDGFKFHRHENNPVIAEPPEMADENFRDPKVFRIGSSYYMVTGCRMGNDVAVFLYSSVNLEKWNYQGILYKGSGEDGTLAECPDFYQLDNTSWMLTFSPENHPQGIRSLGIIGSFDSKKLIFIPKKKIRLDYGLDYYARQTYAFNGRRIVLSWLNQWPWMSTFQDHGETEQEGWRGSLSMPREEKMANGVRLEYPVKEITSRFITAEEKIAVVRKNDSVEIFPSSASFLFSISIDKGRSNGGEISVECGAFRFMVNYERKYIAVLPEGKNSSIIPIASDYTTLDFFFDNSILELFVNKGEASASWIFTRKTKKPGIILNVNQKQTSVRYSLSYIKEEA